MRGGNAATSVGLVVLAIGTAAYAYFVDRGQVSDADRASRPKDVFPSFRHDEVRRIELVHRGETLVLERAADAGADERSRWAMTMPRRDATDPAAIDSLLRELEMAVRLRDVNGEAARGLDAPRVRGTVAVGPLEYRFVLGADAPTPEGAAYMRVDGEGTFVVERSLKVQLLRDADAYRDRALVPYGASEVRRVEIGGPAVGTVILERHGATFRVGSQDGLRASRTAVDRLFGAIADARAAIFLDDAAADRAVASPVGFLAVTPRDPSRPRIALVLGGACPRADPELGAEVAVVRTAPSRMAACVARRVVEALSVTAESLVDDSPFVAHADEIEELRIEPVTGSPDSAASTRVDIARRAAGWHERAPDERDLPASEADSTDALVEALAGARALAVRRPEPEERLAVRARATVVQTGESASETVEVTGPDAAGNALARRLDDGAILRLSRSAARRFEPHPIALAPAVLWRPSIDPGEVVAIDDSCSRGPERLQLDDGTWKMHAFAADNRSVADFVEAFAGAKAAAWIAESDDGSFGFVRGESCVVMLTLKPDAAGTARRVGLIFGASGEGGVYARRSDAPGIFVAPSSLRALASRPPIARGRFRLDPPALARVTMARGGAKLVLSSRGSGRLERLDGDAGDPDKLERALTAFRAEWAIHAGPPAEDEGFDRPTLELDALSAADGGAAMDTRIAVGAPTRDGATDGYFARVAGVDATFLISRAVVDAILDAW